MTNNEAQGPAAAADAEKIAAWFRGRLPEGWVAAETVVDRDEITVVLDLPTAKPVPGGAQVPSSDGPSSDTPSSDTPSSDDTVTLTAAATPDDVAAEETAGRISRFREETRAARVGIAREAERRFERKVAWGVRDGEHRQVFTSIAVPVMTRLRQPERLVLDTLVESGVARSRAHALAWCVSLVGEHSAQWLGELRTAMTEVERVRAAGPNTSKGHDGA